jgi:hypothetical protein
MTIHLQTINSVNAQSPESQDFLRPEVIQKHAACTVLDGGNIFKHAALLILAVLLFRVLQILRKASFQDALQHHRHIGN